MLPRTRWNFGVTRGLGRASLLGRDRYFNRQLAGVARFEVENRVKEPVTV